jgi:hypothetical protein
VDSELQGACMKESSSAPTPAPIVDLTFPHNWQAEILAARPLILPKRHFVYPLNAEEVERGALEVLIRTVLIRPVGRDSVGRDSVGRDSVGRDFSPDISPANKDGALQAAEENPRAVGQGFIPGTKPAESAWALAPARMIVRFARDPRFGGLNRCAAFPCAGQSP